MRPSIILSLVVVSLGTAVLAAPTPDASDSIPAPELPLNDLGISEPESLTPEDLSALQQMRAALEAAIANGTVPESSGGTQVRKKKRQWLWIDPLTWLSPVWNLIYPHNRMCINPPVRKEWRTLSPSEKQNFISAVQCLANKPSKALSLFPGSTSMYDDFMAVHTYQNADIHWVGHFALWHRFLLSKWEKALRSECGLQGGIPYWNWMIDTASGTPMDTWPVFDNTNGLGGNGAFVPLGSTPNPFNLTRTGGGCIPGPFSGNFLGLGPGSNLEVSNPHCITRDFSPIIYDHCVQQGWDETLSQPNYGHFARRLEAQRNFDMVNVHAGGHFGIGGVLGTMSNSANSPGDPLFYLHHGNLERLFWNWQRRRIPERLFDVSGNIKRLDYENLLGGNVTLDFEINLVPLFGNTKLRDLMNVRSEKLCYRFDDEQGIAL